MSDEIRFRETFTKLKIMNILENIDLTSPTNLSVLSLIYNLCIGIILSTAITWHYRKFASTLCNREELSKSIPIVILSTVLIISIVKSSLALSLGLVVHYLS